MAKLPGLTYGGTPQSLGRENIALPAEAAKAYQGIAQSITGMMAEGVDLWDKESQRKADVNTANRMLDWEGQHRGKSFYNGNELPDEIPDTIRYKEVDGEQVPRDNIPAYQVYPVLLEMQQKQVLAEESQGVFLPASRERWLEGKQITAQQKLVESMAAARGQQLAQIREEELLDINAAIDAERYGLAATLVKNYTGTDIEKKEMAADLIQRQEKQVMDGLMVNEDVDGMERAIKKLQEDKSRLPKLEQRQYAQRMRRELKRLEANTEKEILGKGAAERVDQEMLKGGDEGDQLARIRDGGGSQEFKDEAVRRLKIRHAENKAANTAQEKAIVSQFWMKFEENPNPDLITADLPSATIKAAHLYAQKRAQGPIVTDMGMYYRLMDMKDDNPEAFKEENLMDWKPWVAPAEMKELIRLQKNDPNSTENRDGRSTNQQVKDAGTGLGWDMRESGKNTKMGRRIAEFRAAVDVELQLAFEAKGKRLTPQERWAVIDPLVQQERRVRPWYRADQELGVDDIPDDQMRNLPMFIEALRYKGRPVNGGEIYRMYEEMKAGKQL